MNNDDQFFDWWTQSSITPVSTNQNYSQDENLLYRDISYDGTHANTAHSMCTESSFSSSNDSWQYIPSSLMGGNNEHPSSLMGGNNEHLPLESYYHAEQNTVDETIVAQNVNVADSDSNAAAHPRSDSQEISSNEGNTVSGDAVSVLDDIDNVNTGFRVRTSRPTVKNKFKTKKRVRNEISWIDNKAKSARSKGIAGFGRQGKIIKARKMKQGCSRDKCRFKCHKNVDQMSREEAFAIFWNLKTKQDKWNCIVNWLTPKSLKSNDHAESSDESEEINEVPKKYAKKIKHEFHLPVGKKLVKVCRKMFLHTLDISYQWVRTADEKHKTKDQLKEVIAADKRGSHGNNPFKIPDVNFQAVLNHIDSYPVMESHYCRQEIQRKYLEEGLSLAEMYRMYTRDVVEKNSTLYVSKHMYMQIFNRERNCGFFKPKKDRCADCEVYNTGSKRKREEMQEAHDEHLNNKKKIRALMFEDKKNAIEDSEVCVINFDLQKVLTTPRAEIGPLYYFCKLCVWNFTIYDLATHVGRCFVWNETIGCRGSAEISSFLMRFFEEKAASGIKTFFLYSDSCAGQNKNKNIFSMYLKVANDLGVTITHRFFEVGHSQCDGDSMHACIERNCANRSIFTQDEWCERMRTAKKTGEPYLVKIVTQEDIFDFQEISDSFNWTAAKTSQIREITVKPNDIKFYVKYSLKDDENTKALKINKRNISLSTLKNYKFEQLYNKRISLSDSKKRDLQKMIDKKYVPERYENEYKLLINI